MFKVYLLKLSLFHPIQVVFKLKKPSGPKVSMSLQVLIFDRCVAL